jgi:hypothetical protein
MGSIMEADGREIELFHKEIQVMDLRQAGHTWDQISKALGYKDPMASRRIFQGAFAKAVIPKIEEVRSIESNRLDKITLILWPLVEQGDIKAIETVIKLMERRAKMLGLDAPTRIHQEVIVWEGDESIDRAVRDLAALLTRNNADSTGESAVGKGTGETLTDSTGNGLADVVDIVGQRLGQD